MKKIRELGSLPSDAFEKYQSFNLKQVPYFLIFLIPLSKKLLYIHVPQPHNEQFLFDMKVAFAVAHASCTFNSL